MLVNLQTAVERLKAGGLVAIPTETVYGLAARIDREESLQQIFKTKGRPFFDPLIVHVNSIAQAKTLVNDWPPIAQVLAEKFWPGPLTLVLAKNSLVSDLISSGLPTVALRWPRHSLTQSLLDQLQVPVAAPSANKFGRTSPSRAEHVESEFFDVHENGGVFVLDGGPCEVGVESTVLLIEADKKIALLREGIVKLSDIQQALRVAKLEPELLTSVKKEHSPGHLKHHYMPRLPLIYWRGNWPLSPKDLESLRGKLASLPDSFEGVQILKPQRLENLINLDLPDSPDLAARELYHQLRLASEKPHGDVLIFHELPYMKSEDWNAILDRLQKASTLQGP